MEETNTEEEQKAYPYLAMEHIIEPGILENYIYNNMSFNYYWSNDWSPEFYVELAYAGFISVSFNHEQMGPLLLPEMQTAYALLDWKDLHVSRNVKKIINTKRLEREGFYITCHKKIDPVLMGIAESFGHESWVSPTYQSLLHNIINSRELPRDFSLHSIELRNGEKLVAGEIGYTIGATYTSLTGFFNRKDKTYNHMGSVQLLCLAKILEDAGYAFWNMGHPYMQYKINQGAVVLERPEFLKRWTGARDKKLSASLSSFEEEKFYCGTLLRPLINS